MSGPEGGVLARVRRQGAEADLSEPEPADPLAPPQVVELVARACAAFDDDPQRSLALWDEAGRMRGLEELDAVLEGVRPGGFFSGLRGRRRKLSESARAALHASASAGTVRLATAVVGAYGDRRDVPDLEALAVHPDLAHHAVTALSHLGLGSRDGVAALLRLLHRTGGAERVIVIDRLLLFVREPAVRFALVRDALTGLAPEHAREVADAIYEYCRVEDALNDPEADAALRAGARAIQRQRTAPPPRG